MMPVEKNTLTSYDLKNNDNPKQEEQKQELLNMTNSD